MSYEIDHLWNPVICLGCSDLAELHAEGFQHTVCQDCHPAKSSLFLGDHIKLDRFEHLFSDKLLGIVDFCAEEVRRQQDSPVAVSWMIQAWEYAWTYASKHKDLTPNFVETLGSIVSDRNLHGFRQTNVRVGWDVKMEWELVPRSIENLCEEWNSGLIVEGTHKAIEGPVSPAALLYYKFEEIHPFRDGNGRTGKILYNFVRGTLTKPEFPPDFYGGVANP